MFSLNINMSELIVEWEILKILSLKVECVFIFDFISMFFISVVSLISIRVYTFRVSYISVEMFIGRFFFLLIRFVASIFLLIMRPNLIRILLGWDGLGVTSYLLVIFYQRRKSRNAGIITALTNRLGDVGILVCIGLISIRGDWNFRIVDLNSDLSTGVYLLILILAACTKSAQIPFSAWLPAAMAAPTPVSALVHSSTLVTAGVYLIIRFNNLICTYQLNNILLGMGCLTIILAGMAAIIEIDIKKVIALSTLSQLGVIITTLGAQKPLLAYFHLLSHAYFKAILFICAGMLIHLMRDYQDIRLMSKCMTYVPFTFSILMVANLRLCGIPFLRGFYSKDMILELVLLSDYSIYKNILIWFATFLTVTYSCRLSFLLTRGRSKMENIFSMSDYNLFINRGIVLLFPFSIIGGIFLSCHIFSSNRLILLPLWSKSFILTLVTVAFLYSYFLSGLSDYKSSTIRSFFLRSIWFSPLLFRVGANRLGLPFAKHSIKVTERSWLEIILFYYYTSKLKNVNFLSNHYLKTYRMSAIFIVGVLTFIFI